MASVQHTDACANASGADGDDGGDARRDNLAGDTISAAADDDGVSGDGASDDKAKSLPSREHCCQQVQRGFINNFVQHTYDGATCTSCQREGKRAESDAGDVCCVICGLQLLECNLAAHVRVHTGERPFKCERCLRAFKQKIHLQNHLVTHTKEKKYRCDDCGARFGWQRDLDQHIRAVHLGVKHACDVCSASFAYRSHLMAHYRRDHGKSYVCSTCSAELSTRNEYVDHLRGHNGETSQR